MKKLLLLCSTAASLMPTTAYAQSTGTDATEGTNETIVVTGSRQRGVAGIVVPDVPKTRSVLTSEVLLRQTEGQSILQSINLIPGVNYTNNDPYGASGGNLRIRGFPGNRVALLWDGLPLNDTGNYAIFGNQQMDQELIDQVSVNLGTTDVDSPTPSAAGGVVSYRTRLPFVDPGVQVKGSLGSFDFYRLFGIVDTGALTSLGTRAFISGSTQRYDKFRGPGKLKKDQFNARVYQPLGGNGDFVSLAGHYNKNRNNSYNNGLVSDYAANRYFDNIAQCARAVPTTGAVDSDAASTTTDTTVAGLAPSTCTNYYNLRINPSDTWNLRGAIKLTLAPNLVFTADPGYQHTLANGGGTGTINENDARLRGTATAGGVDMNGDGDLLDIVRLYQPSNTRTRRYTLLSSLVYEFLPNQRIRAAYTFDRGNHRQTGDFGYLLSNGDSIDPFGGKYNIRSRVFTADGSGLQNRNRRSIATLQQFSGEYFGRFLDNRLTLTAGVRAPFFKRELDQYCYTSNGTGFFGGASLAAGGVSPGAGNPYCTTQANPILPGATPTNATAGLGVTYFNPFSRTVKYSPILPSAGVSFDFAGGNSVYASYGKNFSSPSTDNLYRSVTVDPLPETTNSYEAGYRFRSNQVQAQLSGFWVDYRNRIVTATDLDPLSLTFGSTIDRNVGDARGYGFEGSVSYRPARDISIYANLSYTDTRIKNDITGLATATALPTSLCPAGTPVGTRCQVVVVNTAGAQFAETPKWSWGGRLQKEFGPLSLGGQYKFVGRRFSTDDNGRTPNANFNNTGTLPIDSRGRTRDYNIFDVDAIFRLGDSGRLQNTSIRVAVTNLLDEYYFANINTQNALTNSPRYSVGSPRTVQATLSIGL